MSQLVQKTSLTQTNQNLTQALTLSGCKAGNTLVYLFTHANFTVNGVNFNITDSQGQTIFQDVLSTRVNAINTGIFTVPNILAGAHTITITYTSGNATDSYYRGLLAEYAGIGSKDDVGSATNNSSTGPVSCTTANPPLAQALNQVFAIGYNENGTAGSFGAPSGWNVLDNIPTVYIVEKVVNDTSAVTANFGSFSSAGPWEASIATYPIIAPTPATLQLLGQTPSVVGATNNILVPLTARVRDVVARTRRRWRQRESGLLLPA